MSKHSPTVSRELVKIARDQSRETKKSYREAMIAAAPMAAASAVSDVPKGWVDKAVEFKIKGVKLPKGSSLRRGLARGTGRLGAGLLTTPAFLSGIKDLKEGKSKEQRQRGMAKLIASGAAFSGLKGGVEAGLEHGLSKKVLSRIKSTASVRGLIGTLAAAGTGASIAQSMKPGKKKRGKKGGGEDPIRRFVIPAAAGAGIGALKGGFEGAYLKGLQGLKKPGALRGVSAKAGGRAASGLLGAVALSELTRRALEKRASQEKPLDLGPKPGQLYSDLRVWSKSQPDAVIQKQLNALTDPEKTPTRRAVFYAFSDEASERGLNTPKAHLRPLVEPPQKKTAPLVDVATVGAMMASPFLVWTLSSKGMSQNAHDKVMAEALDRMIAARGIERIEAGTDFFGNLNFDAAEHFYLRMPEDPSFAEASVKAQEMRSPKARDAAKRFRSQHARGARDFISAPKGTGAAALAHELGHATAGELRRKTIANPLSAQLQGVIQIPAILLPLLAVDGASDPSFTTKEDLQARAEFASNLGKVTALVSAPNLAEEAAASLKALGYLTMAGDSPKKALSRGAKTLIPGFLSHAGPTAAPFIAAAYLRRKAAKREK